MTPETRQLIDRLRGDMMDALDRATDLLENHTLDGPSSGKIIIAKDGVERALVQLNSIAEPVDLRVGKGDASALNAGEKIELDGGSHVIRLRYT